MLMKKYFNLDCDDILDGSNSLISEKRYNFSKEIYNVNLTTHSSVGKLDNDIVKRIAFDIDLYITDMQNLQKLFELNNDKFIDGVNDLLFEIYINVLEDKMKKLLNKDSELDDKNIIYGVDYNENT